MGYLTLAHAFHLVLHYNLDTTMIFTSWITSPHFTTRLGSYLTDSMSLYRYGFYRAGYLTQLPPNHLYSVMLFTLRVFFWLPQPTSLLPFSHTSPTL